MVGVDRTFTAPFESRALSRTPKFAGVPAKAGRVNPPEANAVRIKVICDKEP